MKKFILGTVLVLTMATPAFARKEGGAEGHGGKVWVCKQPDGGLTFELNEFWRSRTRWAFTVDQGPGTTAPEKINYVLNRLAKVDPDRAQNMRERVATFESRSFPSDDLSLFNTGDTIEPAGRKDCELKVVINQPNEMPKFSRDHVNGRDIHYWINRELWSQLPEDQKAGLILHELVYEEALSFGHVNAESSLYVNAWIHSAEISALDRKGWLAVTTEASMPYWYKGGQFTVKKYHDIQGKKDSPDVTRLEIGILHGDATINGYCLRARTNIIFDATGNMLTAGYTKDPGLKPTSVPTQAGVITVWGAADFFTNGLIGSVMMATGKINVAGSEHEIEGAVSFHENGSLKTFTFKKCPELHLAGEKNVRVCSGILRADGTLSLARLASKREFNTSAGRFSFSGNLRISPRGTLVSGQIDYNDHGMGSMNLKKKISDDDRNLKVEPGYPIYFDENGKFLTGAAIVPSGGDSSEFFVKIVKEGKNVGFRLCLLEATERCSIIGGKEFYNRKNVKKVFRVRASDTYKGMTGPVGIGAWATADIGLAVFLAAGAGFPPFGIVVGSVIGAGFLILPLAGLIEGFRQKAPGSVARRLLRKDDFQVISSWGIDALAKSLGVMLEQVQ